MKIKYVIFSILFLIILGAGIGLKMFLKPHDDIRKMETQFKVKASALMDEFQKNESAATAKYSEKPIEISGTLVAKSKLPNGTDLLVLEDEMQGVSCQLDSVWCAANQPAIQALESGKPVTIKGICKGFLMEIKVSPAIVVTK